MAKLNTKIVMLEGEKGKDGTNIFVYKISQFLHQSHIELTCHFTYEDKQNKI